MSTGAVDIDEDSKKRGSTNRGGVLHWPRVHCAITAPAEQLSCLLLMLRKKNGYDETFARQSPVYLPHVTVVHCG